MLRRKAPTAARRRGGDGVVVRWQGFTKLLRRRRGVGEGRAAPWRVVRLPSPHPSIYRGKGEGGRPPRTHLGGGVRQPRGEGERVACPPSQGGRPL